MDLDYVTYCCMVDVFYLFGDSLISFTALLYLDDPWMQCPFGHLEKGCLPLQPGAQMHLLPSQSLYSKQIRIDFFSPACHPDDLGCIVGWGAETRLHFVVVCSSLKQMLHCWRTLALPTNVSLYKVRSTSPQLRFFMLTAYLWKQDS